MSVQQLRWLCFLGNWSVWKTDTGWVLLRWVGGFTSGQELQHSDEANTDCRAPWLNILVPAWLSVTHSLKTTLPSLFCISSVLFYFMPLHFSLFLLCVFPLSPHYQGTFPSLFNLVILSTTYFLFLSKCFNICNTFFNSFSHTRTQLHG